MSQIHRLALIAALPSILAACSPDYSPDVYGPKAVQQVNKVEQGIVIGFRKVRINADGTVGTVTGGAAGGILGAQAGDGGIISALGGVGGTLVGGIAGATVEHVSGDTEGWEYIVRKANGDLLSVTQVEATPIPIGQKVLVIGGNQARIVADYSKPPEPAPKTATKTDDKTDDSEAHAHALATQAARHTAQGPAKLEAPEPLVPSTIAVEPLSGPPASSPAVSPEGPSEPGPSPH